MAIIGGGFLGSELACALGKRGNVVQMACTFAENICPYVIVN